MAENGWKTAVTAIAPNEIRVRGYRIDEMMGHVSFGFSPWDTDKVKAELDKRGLTGRPDIGRPGDIHDVTALYKSYHTTTPDGFDLQISNATMANRTVR